MWLPVVALCAIAIAQPLFDLLGANPEFFVAHRAGAPEILLLTLALAVVLPSLLVLSVRLAGLAGPRAGAAALNAVLAGLACVLAMQAAVRAGTTTWLVAVPISVAGGAAVVLAYRRWALARTFFSVLSIAALVVPGVFLLRPGIRSLVAGQASDGGNAEAPAAAGVTAITTPVLLVIFDELPLVSLLDSNRNIDPLLYPNFAALVRDGVWFRNATTVDDSTRYAVPSILSGRYPRHSALPSAADHPNTLFTLLSRTHGLEVTEAVTNLCPQKLCSTSTETSISRRLASIGRDLSVVFLHLTLTSDLTRSLPDPTETWAGFEGGDGAPDAEDADEAPQVPNPSGNKAAADAARQQWRRNIGTSRETFVWQFIEGIGKDDPQPTFYFLHTLVSHQPHRMLPGGKRNKTWVRLPGKMGWNRSEPWTVGQRYQRHLLQVGFIDDLVGRLARRLKDVGLYDRAMIVITSDHGISYLPNAPQRTFVEKTAAEILRVPLIVKFPEDVGVSSHVSDVNAETVDILPTIADALRIEVPWQVDGTSLLDPARPERASKAIFFGSKGRRQNIDAAGPDIEPALRRKLDLFGTGTGNAHRAPRLPVFDKLVGQPVASLRVVDGGGMIEIENPWEYETVDLGGPAAVFDVAGRFESPRPGAFVAVAVNGVVESVTRTWESNARGWLATPRFDVWRQGRNSVEVFVIDRDESGLLLRRSAVGNVRPPV